MSYYYGDTTAANLIGSLVGLAFAVVLGFVGKSMLEKKGRSGGAGFALGFFLGLIGIIICAVMSESSERMMARMQMMQRGGYPGATGQGFPPMYPPQPLQGGPMYPVNPSPYQGGQGFPPQPLQGVPMGTVSIACKSCGAAMIPGASFCPTCGTRV